MLILLRILIHLFRFSFSDVLWINTDNGTPLRVYREHYLCGLFAFHLEKVLQNFDDKLHGRVVIVDQNDLVHRGGLELGLSSRRCEPALLVDSFVFVLRSPDTVIHDLIIHNTSL